ncbi:MAG: uroporphyrinogen decarboxylase family protein [Chloroflexota bacterium]
MTMTPCERVEAAIRLQVPDRMPVFPFSVGWPTRLVGAKQREYYTDPAVLAAAQIAGARSLGWDCVMCGVGVWRLHPFRPGIVAQEEDDDPQLTAAMVESPADLARLTVPDFAADPYASVPLRAAARIRAQLGPDFPIWMGVDSPWQTACLLRGVQGFMIDTIDRPGFVDDLLAFAFEATAALAHLALGVSGAHLYLMDALASASQISPTTYRRWAQPYEARMADLAHARGAYQMLHICGNTTRNLEAMADTGSDVLDLDHAVSVAEAKRRVGGRVCLKGNVDPVGTLLQGTPEQVEAECRAIIAAGGPGGFILSSGCQVPRDTSVENVFALTLAAASP